ncbi:DUF6233 domain-containing protein [Streptomyces sp. MI02-7b]|uniref:DUF6233 domain-containing protein n=1 Tax=Streptomyces sp. MI02-7b TaxID=462941 RepID=UPI0039F4F0BA
MAEPLESIIQASGPGDSWRLQPLPTAVNQPKREVLHRSECWIDGGEALPAVEAVAAAGRPSVELCPLCRPRVPLVPLPSHADVLAAA